MPCFMIAEMDSDTRADVSVSVRLSPLKIKYMHMSKLK